MRECHLRSLSVHLFIILFPAIPFVHVDKLTLSPVSSFALNIVILHQHEAYDHFSVLSCTYRPVNGCIHTLNWNANLRRDRSARTRIRQLAMAIAIVKADATSPPSKVMRLIVSPVERLRGIMDAIVPKLEVPMLEKIGGLDKMCSGCRLPVEFHDEIDATMS